MPNKRSRRLGERSRNPRRRRILFGPVDVGFRLQAYIELIRRERSEQAIARSAVVYRTPDTHYPACYDYEWDLFRWPAPIRWLVTFVHFVLMVGRYDTFFLMSGETLLTRRTRRLEFRIYRLLRRRLVISFVGADIRSSGYLGRKEALLRDRQQPENDADVSRAIAAEPVSEPWQRRLVEDAVRFADAIAVSTPDLLTLVPGARHLPVTIDVDELSRRSGGWAVTREDREKVVLLHPGHNWQTKGTALVLEAFRQIELSWNGKVRFAVPGEPGRFREGRGYAVTRHEMLQLIMAADIVVDQMLVGWYGMVSLEALVAGKFAVCNLDPKLHRHLAEDCPIIQADPATLTGCLDSLIRRTLAGEAPDRDAQVAWVRANHSLEGHRQELFELLGLV